VPDPTVGNVCAAARADVHLPGLLAPPGSGLLLRRPRLVQVQPAASLEETADIAGRPTLNKQIRASLSDLAAADPTSSPATPRS